MRVVTSLVLVGHVVLAAAAGIGRRTVLMPSHVSWLNHAATDEPIELQLVLKMKDQDIEGHLRRLADPDSSCYGNWMQLDDVMKTFGPDQEATDAVTDWLRQHGVHQSDMDGWDVNFITTIEAANKLFDADFSWYEVRGMRKLRTLHYSIPTELEEYVDLLTPTTYFGPPSVPEPKLKPLRLVERRTDNGDDGPFASGANESCETQITPSCLDQLYDYSWYTPPEGTRSQIGFASFLNCSANVDSYHRYLDMFGIAAKGFTSKEVDGGVSNQSAEANSGEADLDVQMMSAVAPGLRITEFVVGGVPPFLASLDMPNPENNTNEPYLDWYQYLMTQENDQIPQVLSNSYGEPEDTVPYEYARRVCDLIGLMGLRGVTVLESSGDTGVGSGCRSTDNTTAQFDIQFPASCPYITAVGGTQALSPEVAWSDGGGGFSKYFSRPWYQQAAIGTYLAHNIGNETKAYFAPYTNFAGRGVPDVAAHSLDPPIVIWSKRLARSGGTSASAPIVAGIFGLLNAMRFSSNLPSMGFINPWLYKAGSHGLTDVVGGSVVGCTGYNPQTNRDLPGASVIPWASWNSTQDWDPATGLGVPSLRLLAEVYANGTGQVCQMYE